MSLQRNTADLLPKLRAMALADRAVFEKGMKAFVSFVQAYAKHECSLIFRLKGEQASTSSSRTCSFLLFFVKTESFL